MFRRTYKKLNNLRTRTYMTDELNTTDRKAQLLKTISVQYL